MVKILTYEQIDRALWAKFVQGSRTGTWFQTPEAYSLFASLPELFRPFAIAVERVSELSNERTLRGVCVGYVTMEKNAVKQFFTRRAIIIGGPALADDCTNEEVEALMKAVRQRLQIEDCRLKISRGPIYIETRNLNDYSPWREALEKTGFSYQPHLNFHIHTNQPWENVEANIGKHRRKYIRLSVRDGAAIEEHPTIEQVHAYYEILNDLYRTKVKMPLQPWSFFERLYHIESCKFLFVLYDGKVIGGSTCMLLPGRGVYEWYACGKDGVYKNIHPSSVTKYAGMKYASDNRYPVFDMMGAGRPDDEYGVRAFKAEFGGELVEYGRFLCVTKPLLYRLGVIGVKLLKKLK